MLASLAVFWLWPLLTQGYPITHSTQFNLSWAFQYQTQFLAGQFYPRWLEFSNFGFGNATFAFYPPLCMVATLPFRLLGMTPSGSLVASSVLAVFLMGVGLFLWMRSLVAWPWWGSLVVAAVGMGGHYFLGDFVIRGAIAEGWAVTVLPWIGWQTVEVLRSERLSLQRLVGLAVAYGLLVLSHLPTLLLFTLVWVPLVAWAAASWRVAVRAYAALGLALLWTAFYLVPAYADQALVQIDGVNFADEYKPQFRLMVDGLLRLRPQVTSHWYDTTLLRFWWISVVGVGWAGLGLSLPQVRHWRWYGGLLLLSTVPLVMMTDLLGWIYAQVLTLQRIQFSWRWMAVTSVSLPVLWGLLASRLTPPWSRRTVILMAGLILLAGLWLWDSWSVRPRIAVNPSVIATFDRLAAEKAAAFPEEPQGSPRQNFLYWHWIAPDGLSLVDVPEYRAKGVILPMPPASTPGLLAWQNQNAGSLTIQRWQFGLREFQADNQTRLSQILMLRTFDYPAWRVERDGQPIPRERSASGQLQVTVPPGSHQFRVVYGTTFWEQVGRILTVITLISTATAWIWGSLQPAHDTQ
ncbi:MAG: hypothetical protein OHK0012_15080 [Synechococcales cyanobacterium]